MSTDFSYAEIRFKLISSEELILVCDLTLEENILSLVDVYNMAQSLSLDDLMDFTDAFLVLQGMDSLTDEDIE